MVTIDDLTEFNGLYYIGPSITGLDGGGWYDKESTIHLLEWFNELEKEEDIVLIRINH